MEGVPDPLTPLAGILVFLFVVKLFLLVWINIPRDNGSDKDEKQAPPA